MLAHSADFTRPYYCTAFGLVPMHSPLYMRAERLSSKYGRDLAQYLDGWMRFTFIAGKLADNPDLKSCI
jgi:hypothetical protein